MATVARARRVIPSSAPDTYERVLAVGAGILLVVLAVAIARGVGQWGLVPTVIWLHLATIAVALALTPAMLLRSRGDGRHRLLGRIWVAAMLATAIISFGIRQTQGGGFSAIHVLSAATLLLAPWVWWTARAHRVVQHRRAVRGVVTGALLIAGFFTFPFHRLLGMWLFG